MECSLSKRSVLLVSICLLFSITTSAQVRSDVDVQQWDKGIITLTTGEVLEGAVTFYRTQDIITVLHSDSSLSSFSPVNVDKFEVTDFANNRNHLFKTIYWDQGKDFTDFKKPTFFEEILQGKATLLMREIYNKHTTDPYIAEAMEGIVYDPLGYPIRGEYADQIKPRFFLLTPEGDVVMLQQVRRDFLDFCGNKANQVKSFARKNKLNFDLPHEFVAIVNYYNTL